MRKLGLGLSALCLLVAAVGTYLALRPSEDPAPAIDDGGAAGGVAAAGDAPVVLAAGKRAGLPEAPKGAYAIPGKVIDLAGAPVAGVRVTATRSGTAYDMEDPASWTQVTGAASTKKRLDALNAPVVGEPKADAEATTDAEGRFTVTVKETGAYTLRAIPSPPRVGETGTAQVLARKPTETVFLRVRSGVALAGRVVDAAERPVAGAVVTGLWKVAGTYVSASVFGVSTATDGGFGWEAVPEGICSASVTVPGRGTYTGFESPSPRADPWVVRLPAVSAIHGRVLDAGGVGIADVDLVVSMRKPATAPAGTGSSELRGRSGPDGSYRIEGVPPGPVAGVWLLPSGVHLAEQQAPPRAPWSGAEVKPGEELVLDLVLSRGGALEVTVVGEDGAPLEGAEVTALGSRTMNGMEVRPVAPATTDREGHARVEGLALGRYVLYVRHATHYLPELEKAPRAYEMSPEGFPMGSGPPASLLAVLVKEGDVVRKTLRMARGLSVTGRVTGPEGAPVAEARVTRSGGDGSQAIWQWGIAWNGSLGAGVVTDAEGRFRMDALPPTEALALTAKKSPLVGTQSEPVRLAAGAPPPEVVLVMAVGASLSGTVLDAEGKAPVGATLQWWGGDGVTWSNGTGTCDEAGAFKLEGLSAGTLTLTVRTVAGLTRQVQVTPPLKAGEKREGYAISLGRVVSVSGTTVDADGAPVGGIQLNATSTADGGSAGYAVSQADGSFVMSSVPEGPLTIQTLEEADGGMRWSTSGRTQSIRAPAEGVKIVVVRRVQTRVVARIVGPDGAPIPLCTVLAGGAPVADGRMFFPGGGGGGEEVVGGILRREFARTRPFDLLVRGARDADGLPMNLRPKTFSVTTDAEIEVRLEAGREIVGRVVGADARGVAGVTVSGGGAADETAADGSFRLRGIAPDVEVTLAANVPAGWIRPAARKLGGGETSVTIELEKGLVIAGKVLGPDGEPCKQGMVQAQNGSSSTQVGAGGRFRLEGLAPGAVVDLLVMSWNPTGGAQRSTTLKAVRAGTEDLVIRFEAGVTIEGIVVDASGQPATQGWVMASPTVPEAGGAGGSHGMIGADGRFTIEGLRAGAYTLSAQTGEGSNASLQADAPGRDVRLVLPVRVKLSGRVLGSGDRSGFRVTAYAAPAGPPTGPKAQRVGAGRTDADGGFTMDVTGEGPFELIATKPEDDRWGRVADVRPGASNLTLTLELGLTIDGSVEAPAGGPLPDGTWVIASSTDGRHAQRAIAGADGTFRVRGLAPGTYRLQCGLARTGGSGQVVEAQAGTSGHRLKLPEK